MALAEILRITHRVHEGVNVVDGESGGQTSNVEDIGDNVKDIGDQVHCLDDKVQVVINCMRGVSTQLLIPSNSDTSRRQASKSSSAGSEMNYSTSGKLYRRHEVSVIFIPLPLLNARAQAYYLHQGTSSNSPYERGSLPLTGRLMRFEVIGAFQEHSLNALNASRFADASRVQLSTTTERMSRTVPQESFS